MHFPAGIKKKKIKEEKKSVKLNLAQGDKMRAARDAPVQYKELHWSQYGQDAICPNADHIAY